MWVPVAVTKGTRVTAPGVIEFPALTAVVGALVVASVEDCCGGVGATTVRVILRDAGAPPLTEVVAGGTAETTIEVVEVATAGDVRAIEDVGKSPSENVQNEIRQKSIILVYFVDRL